MIRLYALREKSKQHSDMLQPPNGRTDGSRLCGCLSACEGCVYTTAQTHILLSISIHTETSTHAHSVFRFGSRTREVAAHCNCQITIMLCGFSRGGGGGATRTRPPLGFALCVRRSSCSRAKPRTYWNAVSISICIVW